ncbi:hypothetical protein [Mycoplasma sp. 4079]|uniref:hypothetical protein n=1 Tax=Mycoplasma sp. 4079 TaxID=3398615 RepID=UPI0039FCF57C
MKKIIKTSLISAGILTIAAVGTGLIVSKAINRYKPPFYNFRSYMSNDNKEKLRDVFSYAEFNEVNEFNNALINHKAAAGISGDFLAASLIKKECLQKIDYSILLNKPELKNDREKTKQYLKNIIKSEVWEHLENYNEQLKTKFNGEELKDEKGNYPELWEYFFPYFSQDMVIAYNIKKKPIAPEKKTEDDAINLDLYADKFNNGYETNSIINSLKIVADNGFDSWIITDAVRDNLLYGSSYWTNADGTHSADQFTGAVTKETYKGLIDSFVSLIKDGTGFPIGHKNISFQGDGLELLNNLINPKRDVNAAIMYNGDAIDAYYGEDNFPGKVEDGEIRVIKPKENILLVDGLILSKVNTEESNKLYLETIRDGFLDNLPELAEQFDHIDKKYAKQESGLKKQLFIEHAVAQRWKVLQTGTEDSPSAFKELATDKFVELGLIDENENQDKLNNVIIKYADLLDLSLPANKEYLDKYLELNAEHSKFLHNEREEDVDLDDRINIYPYRLKDYFNKTEKLNNFFTQVATDIKNFTYPEADEEASALSLPENADDEIKVLFALVFENEKTFKEQKDENAEITIEKLTDFIKSYIAKVISYLDLSNEDVIDAYKNLTNFNYINYVPSQAVDYELVLRNYFASAEDGIDANVINIYEINNSSTIHKTLQPINDQLSSSTSTYYNEKTKG